MLFVALLVVLPESPRWQVRRQLPQAVIAKTVSAIIRERYVDTHFYLIESASVTKGSIRQLFMGRQLPITLMLWVVFFMSLLIIYLLSSWMPTLLNHRGIDLQHASGLPPRSRLAVRWARWRWACLWISSILSAYWR